MLHDSLTEATLQNFLAAFYTKVQRDPLGSVVA